MIKDSGLISFISGPYFFSDLKNKFENLKGVVPADEDNFYIVMLYVPGFGISNVSVIKENILLDTMLDEEIKGIVLSEKQTNALLDSLKERLANGIRN